MCPGKVCPECSGGYQLVQKSTSLGARGATDIVRGGLRVKGLTFQPPWGCCLQGTFVYGCIYCKSHSNCCCFEEDSGKDGLGVRPDVSADGLVRATLGPSFRPEHTVDLWMSL